MKEFVFIDHICVLREQLGELGGRLLALVRTGFCFTREVVHLDRRGLASPHPHPTDEIGAPRACVLFELLVQILHHRAAGAGRSLHHLDEPGVVRAPAEELLDIFGVGERDRAVEALLGLRPPRALLGALAVGLGGSGRLEASDGKADAVVGHAAGAAHEAGSSRTEFGLPSVHLAVQSGLVGHLALDDLHKHDPPSDPGDDAIRDTPSAILALSETPR